MSNLKNLTRGNITRQLLELAVPLIICNILQQLYNTVDAVIVGRYIGAEAFAAIGVAGTVMNLFIFVIVGGCVGAGIIWAQYFGSGDLDGFRREGVAALAVGSFLTLLISAAGLAATGFLLQLIDTPLAITGMVQQYLEIIFAGLMATFLYNYCSTMLRAVGNTAIALIFLAAAIVLNLVLDVLFIAGFGWGIQGAAVATVIAQSVGTVLCYLYMRRHTPQLLFTRSDLEVDKQLWLCTFRYSVVAAMHNSNLYIGKLLVQGAVNGSGVDMVAAYTATSRLEGFANSLGDSGTAALNIFIAQNVGGGQRQRVRRGFFTGLVLLLALGAASSALMYAGAAAGIGFMLGGGASVEAFNQGVAYMQIISCFYILCFTGNALVGYFEGHGRLVIPIIGATGHIALRAALSYMYIGEAGLSAVAYATGIGWFGVVCFWSWLCYKQMKRESCAAVN